MSLDVENRYTPWIGRSERREEEISAVTARSAAATLDAAETTTISGTCLPPGWQLFTFVPATPQRRLGADGHPERGGFLPPIPLPRRMFAGARMRFLRPLVLGRAAERRSTIRSVETKQGRSGALAFVTVGHAYVQDGETCIEEERDLVYREAGGPTPAPAPRPWPEVGPEVWTREVTPDPKLLFRFSALTFNAHRIHYDRPYAQDEEGYPGLVVHGPLVALLLLELARARAQRPVRAFEFRGQAPLFDLHPFRLEGTPAGAAVELVARAPDGVVAMTARAELDA